MIAFDRLTDIKVGSRRRKIYNARRLSWAHRLTGFVAVTIVRVSNNICSKNQLMRCYKTLLLHMSCVLMSSILVSNLIHSSPPLYSNHPITLNIDETFPLMTVYSTCRSHTSVYTVLHHCFVTLRVESGGVEYEL